MTLKWACAFGLNSVASGMEWNSTNGTPTISTSIFRSNGTSLRIDPGSLNNIEHATYSAGQGPKYYRFYLYIDSDPSAETVFITVNNGASRKITFHVTPTTTLKLYNEEDAVQIGSTSSSLTNSVWYRLELKIDDTTLSSTSVEARLYSEIDEDTLLWNPSGTANLTAAPNRLQITNNNAANLAFNITDIAIIEGDATAPNTWAGPGSIVYLRPNAAGSSTQWSRGGTDSGANWSQTDESSPNDGTDYVESNTNNQIDDYNLAATPAAVNSSDVIKWVAPGVRFAISSTTSTDPDFVLRVTAGGNTQETSNLSGAGQTTYSTYRLGTTNMTFPMVLTDLPGASTTAWTKSDLDSAQIGVRETVTDAHFVRVSALWLMFEHYAGAITTEPADAATAGALEQPVVTATYRTAANDAASAGSLEQVTASATYRTAPADAATAGALDEVQVTVRLTTAPNDALTTGALDSVTASATYRTAPADAASSGALDAVATSATYRTAPADALTDTLLEQGSVVKHVITAPDDALSVTSLEQVTVSAVYLVSPNDALTDSTSDSVDVVKHVVANPADALSGTPLEQVTATATYRTTPNDALSDTLLDAVSVTKHVIASPADALSSGALEEVDVTVEEGGSTISADPDDLLTGGSLDAVATVITRFAQPNDAATAGTLDSVTTIVHYAAVPSDALSATGVEEVGVTVIRIVSPADAMSSGSLDEVIATIRKQVSPDDTASSGALDSLQAAATYRTNPNDALSSGALDAVIVTVQGSVSPDDALSASALDEVQVTKRVQVSPIDALSATILDEGAANVTFAANPADAISSGALDQVVATVHVLVSPDDALSPTVTRYLIILPRVYLEIERQTTYLVVDRTNKYGISVARNQPTIGVEKI